jgi:hypothetical protein
MPKGDYVKTHCRGFKRATVGSRMRIHPGEKPAAEVLDAGTI